MKALRAVVVLLAVGALFALAPRAEAAPAITSLSNSTFYNGGPSQVVIKGSDFAQGATVDIIERHPVTSSVEETYAAGVNWDAPTQLTVDLPTTGLAPTTPLNTAPDADVSWFLRVTNPANGGSVVSSEIEIKGFKPSLDPAKSGGSAAQGSTTPSDAGIPMIGNHLARRAAFKVTDPPSFDEYPKQSSITFSRKWISLTKYEIFVTVPTDYPTGTYDVTVTNTDGQTANCVDCLQITPRVTVSTPRISKVRPASGSNEAVNSIELEVLGGNFQTGTTARLVGFCEGAATDPCGRRDEVIEFAGETVTQGVDEIEEARDETADKLKGNVDLRLAPAGAYSVQLTNPGPNGRSATLQNAFRVIANQPTFAGKHKTTPFDLKSGVATTIEIEGDHFAKGTTISVPDVPSVMVDDDDVTKTSIEVTLKPAANAASGPRDLRVTHADGTYGVCVGCVKITNTMSPADRFTDGAHQLFLERSAKPSELSFWRASVQGGERLKVTRALAFSDEYAGKHIDHLYETILGRKADATGRANWLRQVRNGTRLDQIASGFYGSNEYFNKAGGTNRGYVEALYRDILDRAADPKGRDNWVGKLDRGELNRVQVANSFYQSIESRTKRVHQQYQLVLGRNADQNGLNTWTVKIGQVGDLELAALLASSAEFYRKVTGVNP